jgi:hypothetical protein
MEEFKVEYEPDKLSPLEIVNRIRAYMDILIEDKEIKAYAISLPAQKTENWKTIHAEEAKTP